MSAVATKTRLFIEGMTCQNCARHATDAIRSVPGVGDALVQLQPGGATVHWRAETQPDSAAVIAAVKKAGFAARVADPIDAETSSAGDGGGATVDVKWWMPRAGWGFNILFAGAVALGLAVMEWGGFVTGTERGYGWLALALVLPVQVLCGARFYRGAWQQLQVGRSNMDTLVSLGSTTAFGYSVWVVLSAQETHLYFMEAAGILALISLGHWIEARASERAAGSLRALLNLAPPTARRLDDDNQEIEVPVASLAPGDRVLLKPGDRVPVDGAVVEGQSALDESMLTGEALPIEKAAGAPLYAGTMNCDGRLVLRVTATGEATALAHIIAVVQRAQNSRADIQKLADRISSVFVPVVVAVAVGTGLWWGLRPEAATAVHTALAGWLWHTSLPTSALAAALINAAAVLIVACPCAMGLATPAAIMAGANAAARRGILIRDGQALERSGRINAVLFDKTGTLTEGRLAVAAVRDLPLPSDRTGVVPRLAAELSRPSDHPISRAIAAAFTATEARASRREELSEWRELRGRGVQAQVDGQTVRLGSLAWLGESGIAVGAAAEFADQWTGRGATVLGLAMGDRLLTLLALTDPVKPAAPAVVSGLLRQGQAVFLVSGDSPTTVMAVAQQLGIPPENVFGGVRPEAKAERVKQLQANGLRVAVVGDGINDAPALEQADLGIAVGRASDVAREAADILLLRSDIAAIPEALGLAQATLRTIRQNLFWAFFYNAAAVPLAALGFLSPVLCAAAMGFSDVLVIGNALRLLRWRSPRLVATSR